MKKIFETIKVGESWSIIWYNYGLKKLQKFIPMPCSWYHDKETFKLVWRFRGLYYYRKGFKMVNAPQR